MEHRFERFPEAFSLVVLLPNVPYLSAPHGMLAKVHQIIATRRALLEKEQEYSPKSWTIFLHLPLYQLYVQRKNFPSRSMTLLSMDKVMPALERVASLLSRIGPSSSAACLTMKEISIFLR